MIKNKPSLSYCGINCLECFNFTKRDTHLLRDLKNINQDSSKRAVNVILFIEKNSFEKYHLWLFSKNEILCKAICRNGGGKQNCNIKLVVKKKISRCMKVKLKLGLSKT